MPRLRFPEFRDAVPWEALRGDALFDSVNNRNAPPGLPVLVITQEQGVIPREQNDCHVSVCAQSIANYKEVCEGDFIIGLRSFQGGIECSKYHGICSPAYAILRRRGDENVQFFRHLFKSKRFIQQLTRNLEGIRDGKMISYAQFSEQRIPLPKPAEQQKIADCLDSLDDLIAAQDRKLETLRQHKQGLMQQLFPQPGETVPNLRFPEFADALHWDKRLLGELAHVIAGQSPDGENCNTTGNGVPFHQGKAGFGDRYLNKPTKWTTQVTKLAQPGDILMSAGVPVGELNISKEQICIGRGLASLRARCDKWFLYYTLLCQQGRIIDNGASVFDSINKQQIEKLLILTPRTIAEQQKIADCLGSLDDLIAVQDRKLETLKTHKKGLLQQLFPAPEAK